MAIGGDTSHDHYRRAAEQQLESVVNLKKAYTELKDLQLAHLREVLEVQQQLDAQQGKSIAQVQRAQKEGTSGAREWIGSLKQMKGHLLAVGAAAATVAAAVAFAEKIASETKAAETATARLQVSIEGAGQAMGGLVDEMTLARVGNKAFALGVIQTGEDLERLAGGVRALAEDLGEDPTQLLEDAVTGIGRKSTAILDNLGIVLTATQAEEEYAAKLGKTTAQLTAYEKSQAFAKIAIDRVASAAREGAKANDSFGDSAAKARVRWENFQNSMYGFDAVGGRIRETLREMDEETLKLFGSRNATDIAQINRMLAESGLNYEQIKNYVIDINNIETLRGGQLAREQRLQVEKGLLELTGEALRHQEKQIANAERLAAAEAAEQRAAAEAEAVAVLDHEVAILQALGASEEEIVAAQEAALQLRIEQAEAAGDLAAQVEHERALELLLLSAIGKKNKARGRGVTLAEKITAAGERELQVLDETIARMRVLGQLRGTEAETALGLAELERQRRLAALDLEQRALEATRAKNSVERTRNENRLAQIEAERELIALEALNEQRVEANRLVAEAAAETRERAQVEAELRRQEQAALAEVISLEEYRHRRNTQDIELEGELAEAQARTEGDRLAARQRTERALHEERVRQMRVEHDAAVRELDARQAAAEAMPVGTTEERLARQDELRETAHAREVERLQFEAELRREMEAEQVAQLRREQERTAQQLAMLGEYLSAAEDLYGQAADFGGFLRERRNAEEDAALEHTVQRLQQRGEAQRDQLQAEIDAAEGNAQLQAELRRKQARQEAATQRAIEKAQAQHAERRKRQEARAAGWQLMIEGVVQTVKAVAAYAGFNYVQGALHSAAAAFAFTKGGMLLAGRIPGGGSAGPGMSGSMAANDQSYTDPSNVPGSIPGEAARRESASATGTSSAVRGGGSTVIINGPINALGTIDRAAVGNLATQLDRYSYSRER